MCLEQNRVESGVNRGPQRQKSENKQGVKEGSGNYVEKETYKQECLSKSSVQPCSPNMYCSAAGTI